MYTQHIKYSMINQQTHTLQLMNEDGKGESKLQWTLLSCHIVLLFKNVHVWMYPTSNSWKIFTIFLHIMLEYNLGKRKGEKLFHFIL
jgi:hypothetical protein